MASHTLVTPHPKGLRLLMPRNLRRLSKATKLIMVSDFVFMGLLPAILLGLIGAWWLGAAWMALNLVGVGLTALGEGKRQQELQDQEERNQDLMEHLAAHPGGAPLMADVTSHCGCVLRFAFDERQVAWTPVGVVDSADSCLAMAR